MNRKFKPAAYQHLPNNWYAVSFCLYLLVSLATPAVTLAQAYDVILKNGRILDGTGNSWYRADVGIRNGRISKIGHLTNELATKTINVQGLYVAPGFIDVHTHIENDETVEPEAKNFIYDGVTTVVTGNCGGSKPSIEKYLQYIDSLRVSVNVATLVGHNTIRNAVLGDANRTPTPIEQQRMEELVEKAMQQGAMGLSTGLIYIPGTYSQTPEIIGLAKVAAKYNGLYATHMRDEGDSVAQAIQEAIQIGKEAGLPVQISHFKLSGQNNWGRSNETLGLVKQARLDGLDVTIDQYPYTASSTSLSTLLPDWVLADGRDSLKARLTDPNIRMQVKKHMLARLKKRRLSHFTYCQVASYRPRPEWNGKNIEEINLLLGKKHKASYEAETIMDMLMESNASMVFHGIGEVDVQQFMRYPQNMIASDASIRVFNSGVPHPRGYGTNARVLSKYVRQLNIISLEEAIRRMTSLPAQKFALGSRGLVKEGFVADLVVFDANAVQDLSTYEQPHQYSVGFQYVFVNGQPVVEAGKHNGNRPGVAIYGPGKKTN